MTTTAVEPSLLEAVDAFLAPLLAAREDGASSFRLDAIVRQLNNDPAVRELAVRIGEGWAVTRSGFALISRSNIGPRLIAVPLAGDLDLVAELERERVYFARALALAGLHCSGEALGVEEFRWLAGALCYGADRGQHADCELSEAIAALARTSPGSPPRDSEEFATWSDALIAAHRRSIDVRPGTESPGPIGPDLPARTNQETAIEDL